MKKIIRFLSCLAIFYNMQACAEWIGPNVLINGVWGNSDQEFYVDWGDVPAYADYPSLSDVANDGQIVVANNKHFKLYAADGTWVKNVSATISLPWGVSPQFIANNLILSTTNYFFITKEGTLIKEVESPDESVFERVLKGKLYVFSLEPVKKYFVYSSTGTLLNSSVVKPLELGQISESRIGFNNSVIHKTIVNFPNQEWHIVNDVASCDDIEYQKDNKENLYCVSAKEVIRYSACGEIVSNFILPENIISTLNISPPELGVENTMQIDELYSSIIMKENGDIYTSKVTQQNFSIIKWTWQDSPNDKVGGPDTVTSFNVSVIDKKPHLTWRESLQDPGCVTGYEVSRSSGRGGPYNIITTTLAGEKAYTDFTVESGKTYFYKIRALSTVANSEYSHKSSVTIPQ